MSEREKHIEELRTWSEIFAEIDAECSEAMRAAADYLKRTGWVSVDDRLPDDDRQVRVWLIDDGEDEIFGIYILD